MRLLENSKCRGRYPDLIPARRLLHSPRGSPAIADGSAEPCCRTACQPSISRPTFSVRGRPRSPSSPSLLPANGLAGGFRHSIVMTYSPSGGAVISSVGRQGKLALFVHVCQGPDRLSGVAVGRVEHEQCADGGPVVSVDHRAVDRIYRLPARLGARGAKGGYPVHANATVAR